MSENNSSVFNAAKIADFFVTEYYSRLKKDPSTLYELYHDSGCLTWVGNRGDVLMDNLSASQSVIRAETKERIRSAIDLLELKNCTTYVEVLECSKSINNSLCIMAKGRMYVSDGGENIGRGFVQSFLLTEIRPRWYFIRNDCLIFLDSRLPLLENSQCPKKFSDAENPRSVGAALGGMTTAKKPNANGGDSNSLQVSGGPIKEQQRSNITASKVDKNDGLPAQSDGNPAYDGDSELKNKKESPSETILKSLNKKSAVESSKSSLQDGSNSSDNALSCPETRSKYDVTSYAGKLMGNGVKSTDTKVKGYAIPASNDDNKNKIPVGIQQNAQSKKSISYQKELKNKRKIFVHSIPSNISDEQIRDAVQIQLKIHGGGYIIDIERAKVSGKQWGILELDSEVSCKALLANGLYLGGTEIPIEKWKQPQHSSSTHNTNRYAGKSSNVSNGKHAGSNHQSNPNSRH
ncbi:hypothetical protein FG386_000117 [Cryptosporidium ryanae]|uniref:uncharacterized protein n=1 Tax=Cryptosporidium ryanae TaxID=515981 RepID=UPI00351A8AAC|nr:hypothetical protein FG386_000117 [Cryptosporidium ryanae]